MSNQGRQYDVVLFGATGFTGKLVLQYLRNHDDVKGWAIAGRSKERLTKLSQDFRLDARVGILKADTADETSLTTMTSQSRCVINVVGPFQKYGGAKVVKACIANGCHYVDLSGETGFNDNLINTFDALAKKAGVVIAPSCGLDSLPSDLTTYLAARYVKNDLGSKSVVRATTTLKEAAPFSTGTMLSACDMADNDRRQLMFVDAERLAPSYAKPKQQLRFTWPTYKKQAERYASSYMLSPHNIRTVYRTAGLLNASRSPDAYDPSFAYDDLLTAPNVLLAYFQACVQFLTGTILVNVSPIRSFIRKVAKGGDGPSEKLQKSIQTDARTVAQGDTGKSAICAMSAPGDPGYYMTARMIAECALLLAQNQDELHPIARQGGILTPALIGPDALVRRLETYADFSFITKEW